MRSGAPRTAPNASRCLTGVLVPNVPQTLVAILGHIWDAAGTSKSAQFAFFTTKMVRRNGFSRLSWTGLLFYVFYAHFVAKFGAKIGRKCVTVFIHLRFSFVTLDPHDASYFTMFYATLVFSNSGKKLQKWCQILSKTIFLKRCTQN